MEVVNFINDQNVSSHIFFMWRFHSLTYKNIKFTEAFVIGPRADFILLPLSSTVHTKLYSTNSYLQSNLLLLTQQNRWNFPLGLHTVAHTVVHIVVLKCCSLLSPFPSLSAPSHTFPSRNFPELSFLSLFPFHHSRQWDHNFYKQDKLGPKCISNPSLGTTSTVFAV